MTSRGPHGRAPTLTIVQTDGALALHGRLMHPFGSFVLLRRVRFVLDTGSPTSIVPRDLYDQFTREGHEISFHQDASGRPVVSKFTSLTGSGFDANGCRFRVQFELPEAPGELSPRYVLDAAVRRPPTGLGLSRLVKGDLGNGWRHFPTLRGGESYVLLGLDFIAKNRICLEVTGQGGQCSAVIFPAQA